MPISHNEIIQALRFLGGEARAKDIKDKITEMRGGVPPEYAREFSFRETIQAKIEHHCPESANYVDPTPAYFQRVRRGVYRLIKSECQASPAYDNILDEIEYYKETFIDLDETTRKSVVDSRVGQGDFRSGLISYWKACSVTGCTAIDILSASHIKPWRDSNNKERLDLFNGFLLIPNLDLLFDKGYLTFEDNGRMVLSDVLSQQEYSILGVKKSLRLRFLESEHLPYLKYHRERIYKAQPSNTPDLLRRRVI